VANRSTKRRIAASLTTVLWAYLTYVGYDLVTGVARRHVPSYPSAGQWHYYVHFPLIMLLISAALLLLARKLPLALFVTLWALQIVLFIPFLLGYGGGM
jgi:hypothetical protein